jgi:V/A-type H+-transporting ATPase subunit K
LKTSSGVKKYIAISFVTLVVIIMAVLFTSAARAQMGRQAEPGTADAGNLKWAFISAAISTAFGCIGAGIAVAYVGAAAVGAVGEKPEVAGRTLVFVGLAEGVAIYGLIVAIMILGKV